MIYIEFRTWYKASQYRLKQFSEGFYGLVVKCLLLGLISLLCYLYRVINAFFRRETIAGCIISVILFGVSFSYATSFIKERKLRVEAQYRADSLSYELSKLTQMFEKEDTLIVNGDTLRSW
ncbi:hypothetical protein SAMN04487851_11473 [Prevotella sp. tc2-28]|uniref:hypothetical protein n=1 Tax=Prevotella sp. tc2-28 TaxID=1761888 RepID=UPI00089A4A28|nr:hypothetical protein [Prevotella sp. tc2-28]SEA79992.1 hypothetical protein SAMN04487851_11473 [Prevotella sp. tc2-28]